MAYCDLKVNNNYQFQRIFFMKELKGCVYFRVVTLTAMVFILPEISKSGNDSYQSERLRLTNSLKLVGRSNFLSCKASL